jgi:hypothetical protein
MFCAPGLIFGGTESVGSSFHVLFTLTHFLQYRWRRVPFSWFALPDTYSMVPRTLGLIFMFYAPGLILVGTEGVESNFHILHFRTRFHVLRSRSRF